MNRSSQSIPNCLLSKHGCCQNNTTSITASSNGSTNDFSSSQPLPQHTSSFPDSQQLPLSQPLPHRVAAVRPGPTVQTAVFTIFYWTASLGPYYFHSAMVTDGHGPNSSQTDGLTAVRLVPRLYIRTWHARDLYACL